MKLLFCGDIVGRPGREAVTDRLPGLRETLALDFVIANGENAAGGFGITAKICDQLFAAGVDAISGGNHSWDQREALGFIDREPRLLRHVYEHRPYTICVNDDWDRDDPVRYNAEMAVLHECLGRLFPKAG